MHWGVKYALRTNSKAKHCDLPNREELSARGTFVKSGQVSITTIFLWAAVIWNEGWGHTVWCKKRYSRSRHVLKLLQQQQQQHAWTTTTTTTCSKTSNNFKEWDYSETINDIMHPPGWFKMQEEQPEQPLTVGQTPQVTLLHTQADCVVGPTNSTGSAILTRFESSRDDVPFQEKKDRRAVPRAFIKMGDAI